MEIHNKLVRDKIPEIIERNGDKCAIRTLSDDEFLKELNIKMQEELNEYFNAENDKDQVEELADLEEVLRAVLKLKNVDYSEFEAVRQNKSNKRGAFEKKIYLEYTE